MKGTWQTTPSGGGGLVLAVIAAAVLVGSGAAAAIASAVVTLALIAGIAVVAAVVLSIPVAVWLSRRNRRQAAEVGAELAQRRQAAALEAKPVRQVPEAAAPPAIGQHVHYHWHAAPDSPVRIPIPGHLEEDR